MFPIDLAKMLIVNLWTGTHGMDFFSKNLFPHKANRQQTTNFENIMGKLWGKKKY